MIGIILGILAIILGAKAFTPSGLPLTRSKNLQGTLARVIGVACIVLGGAFIVDGVFASFSLWHLFSEDGSRYDSHRPFTPPPRSPHDNASPSITSGPQLQAPSKHLQEPHSGLSQGVFETKRSAESPSDDECIRLAESVEACMNAGDGHHLAQLFDWHAFCNRAIRSLQESDQVRKYVLSTWESPELADLFCAGLSQTTAGGGSCRFLRLCSRDGYRCALFRVLAVSGEMNYLMFLLSSRDAGGIGVVDIYSYGFGEMLSHSMGRDTPLYVDRNTTTGVEKTAQGLQRRAQAFKGLGECLRTGQFAQALRIYDSLSARDKKLRRALLFRLKAAAHVSEEEHLAALDAFRGQYPDDPSLCLLLIDYYQLKGQHQEALDCIGSLGQAIGGDPYLEVMRGRIFLGQHKHDLAKQAANLAIGREPKLTPAYDLLLRISLAEKDFAETARLLTLMHDTLGVKFTDLTGVEEFAEFVNSPEYGQWRKSAGQLGEPPPVPSEPAEPPAEHEATGDPAWDVLGLKLEPISGEELRKRFSTRYKGGLKVTAVRPQSPADGQGIREGDVLVGLHIWETLSRDNVKYVLSRSDFHKLNPVKFFILRNKETLYGYMPVSDSQRFHTDKESVKADPGARAPESGVSR